MIEENIKELIKKYEKIQNRWFPCNIKGNGGCGRLFESLLGCFENNIDIADYNGIEIKTKYGKNHEYLTLFSCKPEGPHILELQRLQNSYGYPDKKIPKYKILNNSVYCTSKTIIANRFIFILTVNERLEMIFLNILTLDLKLIEKCVFWRFDDLKEKIERKIKYLAIIKSEKKFHNNNIYYKYNQINIYKIKPFETFIKLLKEDVIRLDLKINVYKSGKYLGKTHDHGTSFSIKEKEIEKLYEKIK